ncbi:PsaB RNA binding protein [Haematococcus lacustris]
MAHTLHSRSCHQGRAQGAGLCGRQAPSPASVRQAHPHPPCYAQPRLQPARREFVCQSAHSEAVVADPVSDLTPAQPSCSKSISQSSVWEIDFCSRPLLDERGKKVWELLICDPERNFEYSEYFPNNKINSAELKRAFQAILSVPGAVKPEKARFFRAQMQTIITKAVTECEIKPVPSRRCFTVMSWLQERLESVYKLDPRYNSKAQALFTLDLGAPEPLPDALRGEQWAFVQLPLRALQGMLASVEQGDMFGSTFDLTTAGAGSLPPDILIPGNRRALPLAAWTNGLEIAAVKADVARSSLILETGVTQRWRYGGWRTNQDAIDEAENWEDCKQAVKGIHFLAVQPDPDSEELSGLWLLQDRPPPQI